MRILLINPHTYWKSENNVLSLRSRNFYDNLSIRYLASSLESAGHSVDLFDAHFDEISFDDLLEAIKKADFYDLYGITCTERILKETFGIAALIKTKHKDATVLIGGYGATLLGDRILRNNKDIDVALIGEGELSLLDFVNCLKDRGSWHSISGIMFRENNEIIGTKITKTITDLDTLTWPKRAAFYKYGKANIIASRGCYGKCTYCSITEFHRQGREAPFRVRSPKDVVAEMAHLYHEYGIYYFDFVDDSFITICKKDKEWIDIFIKELTEKKLKLTWGIQSRANDIEEDLFKKLYKAGLRSVSIGIENNVNRVINLFSTGTNDAIHKNAIKVLRKLGIDYFVEMILLEPTTELEEVKENLKFLHEIEYCESSIENPITFSPRLALYTGTPIINHYKGKAELKYTTYSIDYEFRNKEIHTLRQILLLWQVRTSKLASMHLSYPHYAATKKGLIGIAMKTVKTSKAYLKFDLCFYDYIVDYILEHRECTLEELKTLMERFEPEIQSFESKFEKIWNAVYH